MSIAGLFSAFRRNLKTKLWHCLQRPYNTQRGFRYHAPDSLATNGAMAMCFWLIQMNTSSLLLWRSGLIDV